MSESLHEAIKQVATITTKQQIIHNALKEAAANVQTRVGTDTPVLYDIKTGGRKGLKGGKGPDLERLGKKVRAGATVRSVSPSMQLQASHDMNEEDPHVSSDPSHPANRGGSSSGGGRMKTHRWVHDGPEGKVRHQFSTATFVDSKGKETTTKGIEDTTTRGIDVKKPRRNISDSTSFSERVMEAALLTEYDPIKRAARLGKVITGRAVGMTTEPDDDKKEVLRTKLHKAREKLINTGGDHAHDKIVAGFSRQGK